MHTWKSYDITRIHRKCIKNKTKMSDSDSKLILCCLRFIKPAKPPANIVLLILLRISTILISFASLVTLTLSIIFRPWKTESYQARHMEIGLWTICRFDEVTLTIECFDNFYRENPGGAWFDCWRYFLVLSACLQFVVFVYMCAEVSRLNEVDRKPWGLLAYCTLLAGLFTFLSLILFYAKFEFEFVEDEFRMEKMGWIEETGDVEGFQEIVGFPYVMCWCSLVGNLLTAYFSYYTRCEELVYIKQIKSSSHTYKAKTKGKR